VSHLKVILNQTMIIKRRVSSGDAKKMPLHAADPSTFPTTTDPLISIRVRLRDLPYFCMAENHHSLLIAAMAAFSAWISIYLGVDGERGMMAERVRISKRGGKMMHVGQKWRCVNPRCRAELFITESSQLVYADKPRCGCGTVMKRAYEKPTVRRVVLPTDEAHGSVPGEEPIRG
jgi:hypothetical protein